MSDSHRLRKPKPPRAGRIPGKCARDNELGLLILGAIFEPRSSTTRPKSSSRSDRRQSDELHGPHYYGTCWPTAAFAWTEAATSSSVPWTRSVHGAYLDSLAGPITSRTSSTSRTHAPQAVERESHDPLFGSTWEMYWEAGPHGACRRRMGKILERNGAAPCQADSRR